MKIVSAGLQIMIYLVNLQGTTSVVKAISKFDIPAQGCFKT